jgi:hypothetical protein
MSVEKFNPKISGETIPYFQANTYVVQNIKNMEAGFIWIYLLTLPKDWQVIKSHIKSHFGIGDDKIKKIFAYLNKHRLIEYVRERDENGKMRKSEIRILNGSRFIPEESNTYEKSATGVKIHPLDNHTCGKPPTTNNIDNKGYKNNKEKIKDGVVLKAKRPPKLQSLIDINFQPNDSHFLICAAANLDLEQEKDKFIDHFLKTGKKWKDWNAAFRNWLRKASEYRAEKQTSNPVKSVDIQHNLMRRAINAQLREQQPEQSGLPKLSLLVR